MDFVTVRSLMIATPVVIAAAVLGGVTAKPVLVSPQSPSSLARDCALIAAVAHRIYDGDALGGLSLQSTMSDGRGRQWALACDWKTYGLSFAGTFDRNAPRDREKTVQVVSFEKPKYRGRTATVATGMYLGPLAGSGQACELRQTRNGGWFVTGCRETWIS